MMKECNSCKDLTETKLDRTEQYAGPLFSVHSDHVRLPNGRTSVREVIEHVDGVAVLPLDEDGNVLTVTQYRYCFGRTMLEIPAGKLDPGETPREGALRELREETGAVPGEFQSLGRIIPSCGCYTETLHLFLAKGLRIGDQDLDADEFLHVQRIPFPELVRRCVSGEIEDAKTVAAVLKTKLLLDTDA